MCLKIYLLRPPPKVYELIPSPKHSKRQPFQIWLLAHRVHNMNDLTCHHFVISKFVYEIISWMLFIFSIIHRLKNSMCWLCAGLWRRSKANSSTKFQYTIIKSDTSSKDFWNYSWNRPSQCIVSFHNFIGEPLHSITMNVIGWNQMRWNSLAHNASFIKFHSLENSVTQVSSRWYSFLLSHYKFFVISLFFPMWHLI